MAELSVRDKNMMVAGIKVSYQRVRDIWKSAIEQSIEFGGELVYCKSQIEHGSWLRFLEVCDIPQRTATGAMRMHEHRELLREKSAENWVDAVRIIQADAKPNRQRIADLTVPTNVPNRQCTADLSEHTRSPNGGCTSHLEVQAAPRLTSQSENSQEENVQRVSHLKPFDTNEFYRAMQEARDDYVNSHTKDIGYALVDELRKMMPSLVTELCPCFCNDEVAIEDASQTIVELDATDALAFVRAMWWQIGARSAIQKSLNVLKKLELLADATKEVLLSGLERWLTVDTWSAVFNVEVNGKLDEIALFIQRAAIGPYVTEGTLALNYCIFRDSDGLIIESRKPILPHGLEMIVARSLVREHGVEQSEAVSECIKAASHFAERTQLITDLLPSSSGNDQ